MDSAQWSAKQTATEFSVSLFWLRQCAQYMPQNNSSATVTQITAKIKKSLLCMQFLVSMCLQHRLVN